MLYQIKRTQEEIDEVVNLAIETEHHSKWRGMSYEAGVRAAIDWILGDSDDNPMDD